MKQQTFLLFYNPDQLRQLLDEIRQHTVHFFQEEFFKFDKF